MTYLLIPGAGGAAWYWHRVLPELHRRGHDAIAVELPAGDNTAGLEEYAHAVVESASDRDGLVVVAQSMGGLTAPLVCGRLPVSRLILLNAMIPAPGETGGEWWTNTGQDQARRDCDLREGRSPDDPFDPLVYFFHDVPANIVREAMREEPPQSGTPFEQPWPLNAWPDVPTTVLSSREDRLFPLEFQIRVARERLGIMPETLPGGHLVALSRPEELATVLTADA
jgi:pimeloyl-ACP methyl ester carboxylesterase